MSVRVLVLIGLTLATGCVRRATPYRFRAPLVGAVTPGSRWPAAPEADPGDASPRPRRREPAPAITPAAVALAEAPPSRLRLARGLPRPTPAADDLAGRLRAEVGRRRADDGLGFVRAALGGRAAAGLDRLADPAALRRWAERQERLRDGAPRPGDLLLFAPVERDAILVSVAIAVDARGTIEHVYLARGVVRRGWATPDRPGERRDETGRVLNTFVRGSDGEAARGTPMLGGELLVATIDPARR